MMWNRFNLFKYNVLLKFLKWEKNAAFVFFCKRPFFVADFFFTSMKTKTSDSVVYFIIVNGKLLIHESHVKISSIT